MAANQFYLFVDAMAKKLLNLNTDTFNVMILTSAPVATDTLVNLSSKEVATGGGYTTGGAAVPSTSASNATGTETIAGSAVVWTATGSGITGRYFALVDLTASQPVEWWDYGSSFTCTAGNTVTWTPSSSTLLTIGPLA